MVPLKDLVIGIAADLQIVIDKSFIHGKQQTVYFLGIPFVVKNGMKPLNLFRTRSEQDIAVPLLPVRLQVLPQ